MDLYLESPHLWPEFHRHIISALKMIVEPGLTARYSSHPAQRRYTDGPDHSISEEYLEIRQRCDGRLVTVIDLVSPHNKTTPAGRAAYLDTRRSARVARSSIVEIDLVLQGRSLLDYSREGLPNWDYAVTVTRATQPERYEIYTATLEKRLPRFRLPLASDDRDTVVDMTAVFAQAFEAGKFKEKIDYCHEPEVPLTEDQYRRIATLLKWPLFAHEEVAAAAYQIWEEEGRPQGRDREHWKIALERLRAARDSSSLSDQRQDILDH